MPLADVLVSFLPSCDGSYLYGDDCKNGRDALTLGERNEMLAKCKLSRWAGVVECHQIRHRESTSCPFQRRLARLNFSFNWSRFRQRHQSSPPTTFILHSPRSVLGALYRERERERERERAHPKLSYIATLLPMGPPLV